MSNVVSFRILILSRLYHENFYLFRKRDFLWNKMNVLFHYAQICHTDHGLL